MKIKDYQDAIEFFRTNDYQAADGAWSEFYQSEVLEPRIMDLADGGRIGFQDGKGVHLDAIGRQNTKRMQKEESLKKIFDKIFKEEDWGGIKGDTPGLSRQEIDAGIKISDPSRKGKTGGKIPNQWYSQHVAKAIKGDVDALNDLARITGRSVEDLQGAFGKISSKKQAVRSVAAAKSASNVKQVNIDFMDLLKKGTTKKEDFKKLLNITEDEFQDTVSFLFKKAYHDRSKLRGGKIKNSYLGNTLAEFDELVGDDGLLKKIEGVSRKTNQRNATAMIELVFGVDGTHPNTKMYNKMKGRVNDFYKLTKELADNGIILNLDHTIPVTLIDAIQDTKLGAKPLKANYQAISQALNMGLKNKIDIAYADAYKFGDNIVKPTNQNLRFKNPSNLTGKELMKVIDEISTGIGLPVGKVSDNMINLGNNPYLSGDMKQMIYNNLVAQNQISGKAKKLNPELLKKAGLDNLNFDIAKVDTDLVAKIFSRGDANFTEFVRNQRLINSGSTGVSFMGAGGFDDLLKSKNLKKVGSGLRKVGAEFEAAFIGADFLNNLDNGMDTDTAFKTALENATLGIYKGGQRKQWEDFQTAGKELGHNSENLAEVKSIIDLEKMLTKEKEHLENLKNYLESGDPTLIDDNLADLQKRIAAQELLIPKLEKQFNDNVTNFWSKDNAQNIISNYQDTVGYVARKEYNKNVDDALLDKGRKHRVNPEMGSIGSPLWEAVSDWRTYLPQNLMETSNVLRPVVRGLRQLPGVFGDIWDPTSEQAKLSAMTAEEIEQRAKDLNIQEQYYHPVTGNTMTEEQMEPYYERYYSQGGIASLKKKW